jgi:hypothetical protein
MALEKKLTFCFVLLLVSVLLGFYFHLTFGEYEFVALAILFGMLIPFLDSPLYYLRGKLRPVSFVIAVAIVLWLFFASGKPILDSCRNDFGEGMCNFSLLAMITIGPLVLAMVLDLVMPFSRGPLHGFLPAFLYGILVFFILHDHQRFVVCIMGTFFGLLAYLLHMIADNR